MKGSDEELCEEDGDGAAGDANAAGDAAAGGGAAPPCSLPWRAAATASADDLDVTAARREE